MSESPHDRLVELESLVMHLQNDLEQMNNVILDQQRELESLKRAIRGLEGRLDTAEQSPENRDSQEERPPHY